MKIVIIGCTHAGTAAATRAAALYPGAEITVYERNDNVSFLSCGIALYIGGVVKDPQGLFYCSPEKLAEMGVKTRMRHDVTSVDLKAHTLRVRSLATGEEFGDRFDKLIVTCGSWPVVPGMEGAQLENVQLCKNYGHAKEIIRRGTDVHDVAVVGAGYIGVELAEAFARQGKAVTLIDSEPRILNKYLDREFTDLAEKSLEGMGVHLALGQKVQKLEGENGRVTGLVTDRGAAKAKLVVLCIGFRPNTGLFKGQLEMLPGGALVVDKYMRTSDPDVFAAGDSCAVQYNPTGTAEYIPLATNAVRMGTLAALNLAGPKIPCPGTQGTSGIKIGDYNIASTGVTACSAKAFGLDCDSALVTENYRPEFMPTTEKVLLKVVYEKASGRLVGAQVLSKADLTQSANTLSVCIQNRMTVGELAFVDFFFQPNFNKPWNFLNSAGLAALFEK
jgi:NADPH-dependent 2,4-dienoyl-CoA reductase/sulfur reductase-like enzyme